MPAHHPKPDMERELNMRDYGIDPAAPICELDNPVAEPVRDYLERKIDWRLALQHSPDIARRLPAIVFMTGGGAQSRQADGETDFRSAFDVVRDRQYRTEVGD